MPSRSARLPRPVALDGDAVHFAAEAVVVVQRVVPGAAVVPELHRILGPVEAAGEFGFGAVLVESQRKSGRLSSLVQPSKRVVKPTLT